MRTTLAATVALATVLTACSSTSGRRSAAHRWPVRPSAVPSTTHTPSATPASSTTPAPRPPHRPVVRPAKARPVEHCAPYRADRLVRVSIRAQHVWLCHHGHTVFQTAATTGRLGRYTHTPIGHFRIEGLDRNSVLRPSSGGEYPVKFWIPFDAPLFGFHDASWQRFPYGSAKYRSRGSHGCVHLPLAAMRTLYHWARIGTPVIIT